MAAKLIILTHTIAYKCTWWQRAVPFAVLAPGGQSGNFWIHLRMWKVCKQIDSSEAKIKLGLFLNMNIT
jgi:uncharacterized membrane protein